jgi:hypothetical protein
VTTVRNRRQSDPLGDDPDAEGAYELENDRRWRILDPPDDASDEPGERWPRDNAAH